MAYRYSWGAPLEDLAQEGYFGLHKAAMKYDKGQDIIYFFYYFSTEKTPPPSRSVISFPY